MVSRSAPNPLQPPAIPQMAETPRIGYVLIAHDRSVQAWMDEAKLSWSKQYELARGVSDGRWKWADITPAKIRRLSSTAISPHTEEVMGYPSSYGGKTDIWYSPMPYSCFRKLISFSGKS